MKPRTEEKQANTTASVQRQRLLDEVSPLEQVPGMKCSKLFHVYILIDLSSLSFAGCQSYFVSCNKQTSLLCPGNHAVNRHSMLLFRTKSAFLVLFTFPSTNLNLFLFSKTVRFIILKYAKVSHLFFLFI